MPRRCSSWRRGKWPSGIPSVGGETPVWQEGRCVTFDNTFEHEAWNRREHDRVVLIADSWNPDLSEAEQAVIAALAAAIGDFNAAGAAAA